MKVSLRTRQRGALAGRLKLARLLGLDDDAYASEMAELEADASFARLKESGVVSLAPFPKAAFTARRMAGYRLAPQAETAPELLDAESPAVALMRRVGEDDLRACFLDGSGLSRDEKARRCSLSEAEAGLIEDFLTRLWVREELGGKAPAAAPAEGFAVVAGFVMEDDRPALRFFHREAWKGRWRVDERSLELVAARLPAAEAERLRRFAAKLAHTDRRKTTLLSALEALLEAQKEYLATGDPAKRVPLTQRSVAAAVGADPSVINRLAANKAVALPWGAEVPLKALMPSAKTLAKDVVAGLALERPELSDEELRAELVTRGVGLSRRSVAQYRAELGLARSGRRRVDPTKCRLRGLGGGRR